MKIFYSSTTNAFYTPEIHGDVIPKPAVEITAQRHAELMQAVATGKTIGPDAKGYPQEMDYPEPSIDVKKAACKTQAKARLTATDYTQAADVRGMLENIAEFDAYRAAIRGMFLAPIPDPVFPDEPVAKWRAS